VFCYGVGVRSGPAEAERLAAVLDHLEEDVLGAPVATPRADRAAVLTFGRPVMVPPAGAGRDAARVLTRALEERVQALLDGAAARPHGARASPCRAASTSAVQ
jgi:hypothetical protein